MPTKIGYRAFLSVGKGLPAGDFNVTFEGPDWLFILEPSCAL